LKRQSKRSKSSSSSTRFGKRREQTSARFDAPRVLYPIAKRAADGSISVRFRRTPKKGSAPVRLSDFVTFLLTESRRPGGESRVDPWSVWIEATEIRRSLSFCRDQTALKKLLLARTLIDFDNALDQLPPFAGPKVALHRTSFWECMQDHHFPKRMDAQIDFLADSLGGFRRISYRRSRDISSKIRSELGGAVIDIPGAVTAYLFFAAKQSLDENRKGLAKRTLRAENEFVASARNFLRACELVMKYAIRTTDGVIYYPDASTDSWSRWYESHKKAMRAVDDYRRAVLEGSAHNIMRRKLRNQLSRLAKPVPGIAIGNASNTL
jgi:hypothetical protein